MTSWLKHVATPSYFDHLPQLYPECRWELDESGCWISYDPPNCIDTTDYDGTVVVDNRDFDEEDPESYELDEIATTFTFAYVQAQPFGIDVVFNSGYDEYQVPDHGSCYELPDYSDSASNWFRACYRILKEINIPVPELTRGFPKTSRDKKVPCKGLLQVQIKPSFKESVSLAKWIIRRLRREKHSVLSLPSTKNEKPPEGWVKVKGQAGTASFQWNSKLRLLSVQTYTRRNSDSYELLSVFFAFAFEKFGQKIDSVHVQLR